MKKIICYILFLAVCGSSFSQDSSHTKSFTREYLLKKSKNQRTTAWVLLGAGSGLMVTGLITITPKVWYNAIFEANNSGVNTSTALFITGLISSLASIPYFIASSRNKRKAGTQTGFIFKIENSSMIRKASVVKQNYPCIGLLLKIG